MTLLHLAWIHAKVALGVWAVLLLNFTPTKVQSSLGDMLVAVVSAITFTGVLISIVGLVMSVPDKVTRQPTEWTRRGLTVEIFGIVWMLLGGLVTYTGIQVALSFGPEGDQRIALSAFAYAASAMLLARLAMVWHRRTKETRYLRAVAR